MKIYLLLILLPLFALSCSNDDEDIPASSLTKVSSVSIFSNESEELGETFFNRVDGKIWNTDSLAHGTTLKKIKLNISGHRHSAILINDSPWNEIDSVDFAYPIYVTIIAENKIDSRVHELRINIKKLESKEEELKSAIADYIFNSYNKEPEFNSFDYDTDYVKFKESKYYRDVAKLLTEEELLEREKKYTIPFYSCETSFHFSDDKTKQQMKFYINDKFEIIGVRFLK